MVCPSARAGLVLASTVRMEKEIAPPFAPVDQNDPTLAVDDLSEFLPPPLSEDPTLAVDCLIELLPARPDDDHPTSALKATRTRHTDQPPAMPRPATSASASDPTLELGRPEEYFGPVPTVATALARKRRRTFHADTRRTSEAHDEMSPTQRAALEFQRFAEKFHAFAAECQPVLFVPAWSQARHS
jgi:hypothetical protein